MAILNHRMAALASVLAGGLIPAGTASAHVNPDGIEPPYRGPILIQPLAWGGNEMAGGLTGAAANAVAVMDGAVCYQPDGPAEALPGEMPVN